MGKHPRFDVLGIDPPRPQLNPQPPRGPKLNHSTYQFARDRNADSQKTHEPTNSLGFTPNATGFRRFRPCRKFGKNLAQPRAENQAQGQEEGEVQVGSSESLSGKSNPPNQPNRPAVASPCSAGLRCQCGYPWLWVAGSVDVCIQRLKFVNSSFDIPPQPATSWRSTGST
jgi:hypothetical protein